MNLRKLALCLLALPFVWACSSDNDSEEIAPEPTPAPKFFPLNITVEENPLVDPSEGSANTGKFRAPITFLNTLTGFNLSYIYKDEELEEVYGQYPYGTGWVCDNDGKGRWTCGDVGQYGWPENAAVTTTGGNSKIPVTWYAYTQGEIQMGTTSSPAFEKNPYLNFSVEESSTKQHDLLVTKLTKTFDQYDKQGRNLNFTISENAAFKHACSALRFNIKKAKNVKDNGIIVSEVKLCHVKKNGFYYLDSDSWQLQNVTTDYTLFKASADNPAITLEYENYKVLYAGTLDGNNENAYLFLLPQTLTPWDVSKDYNDSDYSYIYLKFTLDSEEKDGYVPFAGTFEMGKIHEVNINIGKNSLYGEDKNKILN